jgi:hypothetical protein
MLFYRLSIVNGTFDDGGRLGKAKIGLQHLKVRRRDRFRRTLDQWLGFQILSSEVVVVIRELVSYVLDCSR